jgi:hypothetical protein
VTDYDYWLKHDKWNSEQAALIFNDKDQRLCGKQIKFPVGDNDFSGVKPNAWQWKVLEYYFIFEKADWKKYVDTKSDYYFYFRHPIEASPSQFFALAEDKQLKLPAELLNKWDQIKTATGWMESPTVPQLEGQPESNSISPALTTFQKLIHEFGDSDDYTKYGADVQQQRKRPGNHTC